MNKYIGAEQVSVIPATVIRIITQVGMVNIDGPDMSYSNMRNMYKSGQGHGLQLSEKIEHKRGEIIDICSEISDKIYELQDIVLKK